MRGGANEGHQTHQEKRGESRPMNARTGLGRRAKSAQGKSAHVSQRAVVDERQAGVLGRVRTTDGQRLVRQGHDISVQAGSQAGSQAG